MSRLLDLAAGRLRIASLVVAAAMVGAGGAAAMTVTTVADSSPTPTVSATDTSTDTESTEPTETATDEPLDPAACEAAGNHGEYVSFIAQLTQGDPTHGVLVSEAAHSDCGKTAAEEPTDTATDTEGTDSTDDADATAKVKKEHKPKKDHSVKTHGKSGQSHGRSGH